MKNQIIHGNCLEIMKDFIDESIDLVVTSPPYDNLRDYKGYIFEFELIANELFRTLKKGGVIVWVIGDATINGSESGTSFKHALYFMSLGLNLHDTMIWQKSSPPLTHNRYEQHFEYMFVFSKGKPKTFNPIKEMKLYPDRRDFKTIRRNKDGSFDYGKTRYDIKDKIKGNVWKMDIGMGLSTKDKFAFQHPAVFPEELPKRHIASWTNTGDLVLDPMCGSGTTLKMAKALNRNYIGIDISKEYCEIAEMRVQQEVISFDYAE